MRDWLHNLPVAWMTVAAFAATYVLAGVIFAVVNLLARGERARVFKSISPGMLPPLGTCSAFLLHSRQRRSGATSTAPMRRSTAKPAHWAPSKSWPPVFQKPRRACAL
jgi:hypothetical protein